MGTHRPVGLALLVLVQGPAFVVLRLFIGILPLPARLKARWQWTLRKGFWNNFGRLKFRGSRPLKIPVPVGNPKTIDRVLLKDLFPLIPINDIHVAGWIPPQERDGAMMFFTRFQLLMYRLLSPMQPGLPPIDADPYEALRQAYGARQRKLFSTPVMPLELQGSPDLGALAVRGPYACYLRKYQPAQHGPDWDYRDLQNCINALYVWDFQDLAAYEHEPGLYNLGAIVLFRADRTTRTVKPVRIKSELGLSKPDETTWEFAKTLALCAATTHLSLVRHFNGVHLAAGAHLAIATRNNLFPDHPLFRLLWPYIFRTHQSNRAVTLAQMAPGGDFDSIFSFTRRGLCQLFGETYRQYQFAVNDPERDASTRGIAGGGFETPTQQDQEKLFAIMLKQARDYIALYYHSDADLAQDQAVQQWFAEVDQWIPSMKVVHEGARSRDSVARVIASVMYMVTVQHQIVGAFLWNYQLWAHNQPPRLYRNGTRLPLDVYQRLVNANFNLNVPRTPLMLNEQNPPYVKDYAYLTLPDGKGAERVPSAFQTDLRTLETTWRAEPWSVWRVYPRLLDVNINA